LARRRRDPPDRLERPVALRTVQLLFHLRQCRSDDVVMMDVRPDGFRRIEPETMDLVQVA